MTLGRGTVVTLSALLLTGCSGDAESDEPRVVQLASPGQSNRVLSEEEAAELDTPEHTDADVAFVQAMIPHHAQALEMTDLVPERTSRDDIPLLAERIALSQQDEIALLERWLTDRGEQIPDPHAHHHGSVELMPGMLTDEQLTRLRVATGAEFDQLFLQSMIYHHEGALVMVDDLLTGGEGGQEPEIFQLAQHIDSDQRIEIARMNSLLRQMAATPAP
ncbi:MAG TPA: DUF305 domain-containing protein [Jiangellaceae bacterium]